MIAMRFKPDITVACLLSLGFFWLGGLVYQNHGAQPEKPPPLSSTRPATIPTRTLNGEPREFNPGRLKRPTLLLVFSADCRYCEQNAPQWRDLVSSFGGHESPPAALALSLSGAEHTASYLEEHHLDVPALLIGRDQLASLGLPGVPGTIVLEPGSETIRSWLGILSESETAVILTWATAN